MIRFASRAVVASVVLAVGLVAQSDFRLGGLEPIHGDRGGRVELELSLEVPSEFHLLVDGEMATPRFELSGADPIRWEWGADPAAGVSEVHGTYRRILTGILPDRDLDTRLSVTAHYMPCTEDVCHAPQQVVGTVPVRVGPVEADRSTAVLAVGGGVLVAALGALWILRSRRSP